MPEPVDQQLYQKVKAKVYKRIPKHSAYRSGVLVQEYKRDFKKRYGNRTPYHGKKKTKKLDLEDGSLKNGVINVARWVILLKVMSIDRHEGSQRKRQQPFVN